MRHIGSLAQTDSLAKLLIEKGLITRKGFYAEDFRGTDDVSETIESEPTMNIGCNNRRTPTHIVFWIWTATLLVLSAPCLATTIVAVRTPDAVVIAADSEGTFKGGNTAQTRKDVRKIFEEDGILYTISGRRRTD